MAYKSLRHAWWDIKYKLEPYGFDLVFVMLVINVVLAIFAITFAYRPLIIRGSEPDIWWLSLAQSGWLASLGFLCHSIYSFSKQNSVGRCSELSQRHNKFKEAKMILCEAYTKPFEIEMRHLTLSVITVSSLTVFINNHGSNFWLLSLSLITLPFVLIGYATRKEEKIWESWFDLLLKEKGICEQEFESRVDVLKSPSKKIHNAMQFLMADLLVGNYTRKDECPDPKAFQSLVLCIDPEKGRDIAQYQNSTNTGKTPVSHAFDVGPEKSLIWSYDSFSNCVEVTDLDSFGYMYELIVNRPQFGRHELDATLKQTSVLLNGSWVGFEGEKEQYTKTVTLQDFSPNPAHAKRAIRAY